MKLTGRIVASLFLLPIVLGVAVPVDEVRAGCAVFLFFVSLPVSIIWCIDRFRNDEGGAFFRGFMRMALIGLGVTCVVESLAVIGWVLWNIVVERQKSFELGSVSFIIAMLVFGVGMAKLGISPRFSRKDAGEPSAAQTVEDHGGLE